MSLLTSLLSSAAGSSGGGSILTPVVCASTAALTVTYANGSGGVGATLTNAGAQAAISLDGQSPTAGQRVLIKDQASALQNGLYTVTTVGTGATNWVLTRATDFDEPSEMTAGVQIDVINGTVNATTVWILSATVTTVGTTAVTFVVAADAGYTASRALVTNSAGRVVVATTTATEVGYVNGVTSAIQTQLNNVYTGVPFYAADAGATDDYAITLSPALAAYVNGMVINFKANTANTGAATLAVNGLTATAIKKLKGTALATGDIVAGQFVSVIYDGTNFEMQSQTATSPVTSVATAGLATGGTITSTGTITVTAAVQSDQETGSSTTAAVVPGVQQFHPSAAKAWCMVNATLSAISASYNMTSITDGGTGLVTFTIATDFSSTNWNWTTGFGFSGGTPLAAGAFSMDGTSLGVGIYLTTAYVLTDPTIGACFAGHGDQ